MAAMGHQDTIFGCANPVHSGIPRAAKWGPRPGCQGISTWSRFNRTGRVAPSDRKVTATRVEIWWFQDVGSNLDTCGSIQVASISYSIVCLLLVMVPMSISHCSSASAAFWDSEHWWFLKCGSLQSSRSWNCFRVQKGLLKIGSFRSQKNSEILELPKIIGSNPQKTHTISDFFHRKKWGSTSKTDFPEHHYSSIPYLRKAKTYWFTHKNIYGLGKPNILLHPLIYMYIYIYIYYR